jgi:hypothetical protein
MASMQSTHGRTLRRFVSLTMTALLAACGGGGGGGGSSGGGDSSGGGNSSAGPDVTATAAHQPTPPSASCSAITHLQVSVTAANSQSLASARTIDLMAPQAGVLQSLGLPPLGANDAAQVRLAVSGGTVTFSNGATAALKVPGGTTVTASTQVPAATLADLVVPAFNPCTLVHAAGNSGQWLLTGNVAAQLRALPFSTSLQLVQARLRAVPDGSYATVQINAFGSYTAQRFDAFGNALGAPVSITLPFDAAHDGLPLLTPLVSGYLGTWLGPSLNPQQMQANDYPLFAQLFDASGAAVGSPVQVGVATPFVNRAAPTSLPKAVALPDGGAALVWSQSASAQVYMQRFTATGLAGGAQHVNVTSPLGGLPNVVGQDNGNVIVVWGVGTLYARVFAPDGTAGPQQTIATGAQSFSGALMLSAAPGGGAAVAWEAATGSGVVFLVQLGADGAPVAGPQPVTDMSGPPQMSPSVGVLADGSAVVAWAESGSLPVLARRFAADGTPLGAAQTIVGSHAVGPVVVPLAWGGFIIEADTPGGLVARLFDAHGLMD